ncbi:putative FAD-linked oxidoreductase [Corynebacterium ciconiae DSM 44920]|uniref:FAD-binding and (Fe-S)-binding domain-containing protein n=1 Tax=Corynebacterium ciconiae TaxID=227319 RepID=UPI00035DD1EC|nr:FAD-binding and (Fe-S)-binding domain-containing protein [Corynebacterium ciconiae]WKD60300.1 putative FAD-linked oxidoreductase [Corynebacterium ciconiae DSM 44920]
MAQTPPRWAHLAHALRLRQDMTTRAAYTSDASVFRRVPAAVVEPRSAADVRDALELARLRGWSVTSRGGGTSVAGNAIGEGLIIDTSRHLTRILEIDPDTRTALVEPGVVCDRLREAVAPYGLSYGPDPSTHSRCTIGGMVANNACGSHSVAWGTAADNLVEATLLLADGREVQLGPGQCSDKALKEQIDALWREHRELIETELGRFPRQVSGYGLHYLLPAKGGNYAQALAGSEGTLGVFTQLRVKLVETPPATALAVLAYDTVFDAAAAAPRLRREGVSTIEGMGGDLLAALRAKNGEKRAGSALPGVGAKQQAGGWLFCETTGETLAQAESRARSLVSAEVIDHVVVSDPQEMGELWRIRESSAGLATRLPDGGEAWPSWEDSAVPPENLASYLRGLYELMDRYGLRGIPFGHFGEGCIHVRISFDLHSEEGIAAFRSFMHEAAELVTAHGGSLSGEHGDGRARSELLEVMYSPQMLELFARFKHIFDPEGHCNPGVLVQPEALDAGLRISPQQQRLSLHEVHAFSKDRGELRHAINRCVGVGACRSMDSAMCPSFQLTHDEVHSTRGRARVLSEMLHGTLVRGGMRSREVHQALDLCLSCKACAKECPVNVDMATYKAEFLAGYYRRRIRPRAHYSMGWLPLSARLVHAVPGLARLADAVLHAPGLGRLIAWAGGIDSRRPLIHLAPTSIQRWAHGRRPATEAKKEIVLWPDSFSSHLDTGPAQAVYRLLEHLGYRVHVPRGFVCCGLTWHSTGQLAQARRVVEHSAAHLAEYLDRGLRVVTIEPSCSTQLLHEATELSDNPQVERLAQAVVPWAQVIAEELDALDIQAAAPLRRALTQVHCHERALGDPDAAAPIYTALGLKKESVASGCCGLAGNWGYERGHAEMSLQLGEREVFPRVRQLQAEDPEAPVIADGFSCRTHIEQGTGMRPRHLAEVLAEALGLEGT